MKTRSQLWVVFGVSAAQSRCQFTKSSFESLDFRWSALCHVLASAAAPTQARQCFFHESSHVEWLARGLGKYQCRLIGSDAEGRDHSETLAC